MSVDQVCVMHITTFIEIVFLLTAMYASHASPPSAYNNNQSNIFGINFVFHSTCKIWHWRELDSSDFGLLFDKSFLVETDNWPPLTTFVIARTYVENGFRFQFCGTCCESDKEHVNRITHAHIYYQTTTNTYRDVKI